MDSDGRLPRWIWWVVPLVIAVAAVAALVHFAGHEPDSPYLYDSF